MSWRYRQGFTLIEILVVLVIVGLLAGTVSLVVGGNRERRLLDQEAEAMRNRFNLIHDESVFAGKVFGFALDEQGRYRFQVLDEDAQKWHEPELADLSGQLPDWLKAELKNDDVTFVLRSEEKEGDTPTFQPQIVFTPGGEYTPFEMTLSLPDETADQAQPYTLVLAGDGYSAMTLTSGDASHD